MNFSNFWSIFSFLYSPFKNGIEKSKFRLSLLLIYKNLDTFGHHIETLVKSELRINSCYLGRVRS